MTSVTTIQPLRIEVDGIPLTTQADEALTEIYIWQQLSDSSLCKLTFVEPKSTDFIKSNQFFPGTRLKITSLDTQQFAFSGTIKGFEYYYGPGGERVVVIIANDGLYPIKKRQQVKVHIQVTVPEIAKAMLADFGVSVTASVTSPVWDHIVQHHVSDLLFLRDYSERSGLYFFLLDDKLNFYSLSPAPSGIVLKYRQSLLEITMKSNTDWSVDSVTVKGWNPWQAEAQMGRAQKNKNVGSGQYPQILSDYVAQNDGQLDALAAAQLDRAAAFSQFIKGTAEGDFRLTPGTTVQIEGLDTLLNGSYLLASVEHRINAKQGFVTVFDSTPPPKVQPSFNSMATIAKVTQVNDPNQMGRVKVQLYGYNDVESDWLQVVITGAGANKGLVALPEVDDKVLILMLNGRPDQAIIIGGLYGELGPPEESKDHSVYRFLTPGGQTVRLNDKDKSIKLETSNGQFIELIEQTIRIHSKTDCTIEAPGNTLTLKANKINFERG